jgi:small subunit ribosomal protein S5e
MQLVLDLLVLLEGRQLISPLRRVNQAIYLLTTGARESAFRNIKTIAECLADELINAAKGSSNRSSLSQKI